MSQTEPSEKFEQWCIVEVMGHKKFAGFVSEQTIGGTSFIRVDVPEVTDVMAQKLPAFSKLLGASSIYCLSPCTQETAMAFAAQLRTRSFAEYEAPRIAASQAPVYAMLEDDPAEHDADFEP